MRLSVGIRDFKNRATQYFRRVREENTEVIVTMDGVPIARVVPIGEISAKQRDNAMAAFLSEVEKTAAMANGCWRDGENAVDAVRAQRRDF
jgi:prevent-host-death family protein